MANTLFKVTSPAIPGKPGTPGRPAYCEVKTIVTTGPMTPIIRPSGMSTIVNPTLAFVNTALSNGTLLYYFKVSNGKVSQLIHNLGTGGVDLMLYATQLRTKAGDYSVLVVSYGSATSQSDIVGYAPGKKTSEQVKICYPAVDAIEAIKPVPEINAGWNGGARGIARIDDAGAFTFSVPTAVVGAMVGLTQIPDQAYAFNAVTHGFSFSRGSFTIRESGAQVGGAHAFTSSDEFAINVMGRTVQYLQNGSVLATSATPRVGIAWPMAVLYVAGDTVVNAAVGAVVPAAAFASGSMPVLVGAASMRAEGALEPMGYCWVDVETQALTGTAGATTPVGAAMTFQPMTGTASDKVTASAAGALPLMTTLAGAGDPMPLFCSAYGDIQSLLSFSNLGAASNIAFNPETTLGDADAAWEPGQWDGTVVVIVSGAGAGQTQNVVGNTGQVLILDSAGGWATLPDATSVYEIHDALGNVLYSGAVAYNGPQRMQALRGLAGQGAYAEARVSLMPLSGIAFGFKAPSGVAMIEGPGGYSFEFMASGDSIEANTFNGVAPSAGALAFGGGSASLEFPWCSLQIEGDISVVASVQVSAPAALLTATGTLLEGGGATLRGPRAKLSAFSGGSAMLASAAPQLQASGRMLDYGQLKASTRQAFTMRAFSGAVLTQVLATPQLQASGAPGIWGEAKTAMPMAQVVAAGQPAVVGEARLVMPLPLLTTSLSTAVLVAPAFRLSAIGSAVEVAVREAWAVNLEPMADSAGNVAHPVTHYANFPFIRMVAFAGAHYGITAAGLFLLEGDTDDGQVIPWAIQTAPSDYGSIQIKRAIAAYLCGNFGPSCVVSVVEGEKTPKTYTYANQRGTALGTHRRQFGRGLASRHYAFGVSDAAGGLFELESLDVELVEIGRAVR